MNQDYFGLLTICVSTIIGVCGVASIFVAGWVKASRLSELRTDMEKKNTELVKDISVLWEKVTQVEILGSKLATIEKSVDEIKEMLREQKRN